MKKYMTAGIKTREVLGKIENECRDLFSLAPVGLAKTDRFESFKEIRNNPLLQHIPVIALKQV